MPNHARIAAKILSDYGLLPPKRMLKHYCQLSRRILSKLRSKLSADHVNELSCLIKWMNDYHDSSNSSASIPTAQRNERFASLTLELELEVGPKSNGEDDDEEEEL